MTKNNVVFIASLLMQIYEANPITFTKLQDNFTAKIKYELPKESKDVCLRICFEESDCTHVQYNENVCTIFKSGEASQAGRGNVYALDRQLVLPTCERPLPLAPNVEFEQVPVPTMTQSEARKAELLAMSTTASLTIIDRVNLNGIVFFIQDTPMKLDGAFTEKRYVFAKEPNPECVSVPVFQRASQRRLYFGDVYNVTGYTFMDAYAFTDRCACAGICCGQLPVEERFSSEGNYYYQSVPDPTSFGTEVNQAFYIVGILYNDNTTCEGVSKVNC